MQQQKNSLKDQKQAMNRRKQPRENDRLFKFMVAINVIGWFVFLAALLVFHYARPEFISGVQAFWGVTGRQEWSASLSHYLVALLIVCVVISLLVLIIKRQRNRRENDYYGINGYVLMFAAASSLIILYFEFNS
jgi:heme/copper-type cytochrome/quinol oxidase subunit 2